MEQNDNRNSDEVCEFNISRFHLLCKKKKSIARCSIITIEKIFAFCDLSEAIEFVSMAVGRKKNKTLAHATSVLCHYIVN